MKEQEIKEMACAICGNNKICLGQGVKKCILHPQMRKYAENAYKEGYRKQKEGEWIDKPTGAYSRMQSWCSACGKHSGIGGIESNRHKPFCPNCGAKMKGGAE